MSLKLCAYTAFLASTAQAATKDNSISGGLPTSTDFPVGPLQGLSFGLSMHGGLLYLDWMGVVKVESISVYDLHGRLLFTFQPGAHAQTLARWVWDGHDSKGRMLGVGQYLIRVKTQGKVQTRIFTWDPTQ